ncbi:hypothetical protein PILCRDRAFT_6217 [Piloderma croceum F 1598]|uniref:Asparagine synthetase domain-containing protein n=1 Tax=Piloderma croceum (strain F 1598) TaxID=765440 RepID=A0A0C3FY62_PILCF|nr:hypothetical protein PILCRDRAFT_6217 [Piloderma croceum F 1598]
MCGIFFAARLVNETYEVTPDNGKDIDYQKLTRRLQLANSARGPDAQKTCHVFIKHCGAHEDSGSFDNQGLLLDFFASELRLRGKAPVVQPHEHAGDIFCWNGEIFEGMDIAPNENDGIKFFESILSLSTVEELVELFGSVEGPYAFSASKRLFFGRDPLGRRSVLIHKPTSHQPYFFLASVSAGHDPGYEMEELSTKYFYCLDLQRLAELRDVVNAFDSCLLSMKRTAGVKNNRYGEICRVNPTQPPHELLQLETLDQIPDFLSASVDDLIAHLDKSVMLRVRDIPRSPDKEGQARVAVLFSGGIDSTILTFFAHRHLPIDEPIDLLNVAFENPRKMQIQVEGNIASLPKKQKKAKMRQMANTVSGTAQGSNSYRVPDRVTGLEETEELRRLCPGRVWNFVEVDVPYDESQAMRCTVEGIMYPGQTVMDLSLAMALYFASRGIGKLRTSSNAPPEPYTSPAKVLLNGLGSDELLGGYGRHRTAFTQGGWRAVIDELQLELDRIPTRNLGRDDRVISSHGKETRHPFLSLSVVSFLAALPVHFKLDPRLELGLGDKMLLRLAARKVGLVEASHRKKRAMQFGSHSARMEVGANEKEGRGDLLLSSRVNEQ